MLLIQIPDGASTSESAISFPFPLNLMSLEISGEIVDLNLRFYKKNKEDIINGMIEYSKSIKDKEVIINCGEFPCDGKDSVFRS